jgi:hypothetical protein
VVRRQVSAAVTPEALEKIRDWDAKCGENELIFFGTTIDRRRLLEYVDELELRVAALERQLRRLGHYAGDIMRSDL